MTDLSTGRVDPALAAVAGTEVATIWSTLGAKAKITIDQIRNYVAAYLATGPIYVLLIRSTVAALPAAAAGNAGTLAWVTNASGTKLCVSDGSAWKVVTLGSTVST